MTQKKRHGFFPHLTELGVSRADKGRWAKLRADFRNRVNSCLFCNHVFAESEWKHVDHRKPHRGDVALLLDPRNLQVLCGPCHNSRKRLMELHANKPRVGLDGWPVEGTEGLHR